MKKSLAYGMKALSLSWKANGVYSLVTILATVYDSTLYPFIQVFLLAKVLDLFSSGQQVTFTDLSLIIIGYLIASVAKLTLKSLMDVKEAYLQIKFEGYIDLQISKKLTELDPATFENPEFQNLIAQLEGVKGTIQMHLVRFISLIDAVFKFTTAALVVSVTFPLFAPIILIATIPSYIAFDKFRISTWPFYVEKRSVVTRVTQYIKNLLFSDSTSKESAIFKTGETMLAKIKKQQQLYFSDFDKVNGPWSLKILLAKLIQFSAFVYTQHLNLSRVFMGTLTIGNFALVFQQSLNLTLSAEDILNQYSSMAARNKYIDKYVGERVKRSIKIRGFAPDDLYGQKERSLGQSVLREVKLFSKEKYKVNNEIMIYDNKIAAFSGKDKMGIIIENGALANTFRSIWQMNWDLQI